LDRLVKFEGIPADDKEKRIAALEAYIIEYDGTIVASRARVLLRTLKAPPAEAPSPSTPAPQTPPSAPRPKPPPVEKLPDGRPAQPGLIASYSRGKAVALSRVDASVDFHWADKSPIGETAEPFSAEWKGWLNVVTPGRYTFRMFVDDGKCEVMLYVKGDCLANQAFGGLNRRWAGNTIELAAGLHQVRATFRRDAARAGCRLAWALKDSFPEETIPPEYLWHDPGQETAAK
jgi:hypothetical protein